MQLLPVTVPLVASPVFFLALCVPNTSVALGGCI